MCNLHCIGDTDINNVKLRFLCYHNVHSSTSSEVRTVTCITYMEDRQLQHHKNVDSRQFHDCSSEERTLFQYISNHPEILGQSLFQRQSGRQQQLLYKQNSSMIYCILSVKSKYLQCYKHKQFVLLECPSAPKAMVATTCN